MRLAIMLLAGIGLAACGGGDDSPDSALPSSTAATTTAPIPTTTTVKAATTTRATTTLPPTTTTTLPPYTEDEVKAALLPAAQAWAADYNDDSVINDSPTGGNTSDTPWVFAEPLAALRSSGRWPAELTIPDPEDGVPNDLTALADRMIMESERRDDSAYGVYQITSLLFDSEDLARWVGVPLVNFIPDGTYKVGTEIQPGTYVADHPVSACYWERQDAAGEIIDNNFVGAALHVEVTIRASDFAFHSDDCGPWVMA